MIQSLMISMLFHHNSQKFVPILVIVTLIHLLELALLLRSLEHVQDVAPPDQVVNLLSRKATLLEQALQPRELLLNIARVLLALLSDLAVVLSVLLLSAANGLLKLLLRFGAAAAQRADDLVEGRDGAG